MVSDSLYQYISYYGPDGHVMVGKRAHGSDAWTLRRLPFTGNVRDGHNVISLGIDGQGRLHLSFDHHGHPLHYARPVDSQTPTPVTVMNIK